VTSTVDTYQLRRKRSKRSAIARTGLSAKKGFCDRQLYYGLAAKRPATIKMLVVMIIDIARETTSPRTHHSRVRAAVEVWPRTKRRLQKNKK
jgi:hypothetical protein